MYTFMTRRLSGVELLFTKPALILSNGKVEQSREMSSILLNTSVYELMKSEPSGHPRQQSLTLLAYTFVKTDKINIHQLEDSVVAEIS